MKCRSLLMAGLVLMAVCLFSCKPNDAKVQQAVNEKLTATPGITAEVLGGIVTLSGEAPNQGVKTSAEEAVRGVKGVTSVTNNIMVQAPVPAPPSVSINPDDVLKNTMDSAFSAAGFSDVTATVSEGVVTLEGKAKRSDLRKIMQTAQEAKPKKVVNKLTLQ